jgi:malate synthase
MEDAATAEITRVQLWQWVHYRARISGAGGSQGAPITAEYIDALVDEVVAKGPGALTKGIKEGDLKLTAAYVKSQVRKPWPSDFLTSDFMDVVAERDGVKLSKWQKSLL